MKNSNGSYKVHGNTTDIFLSKSQISRVIDTSIKPSESMNIQDATGEKLQIERNNQTKSPGIERLENEQSSIKQIHFQDSLSDENPSFNLFAYNVLSRGEKEDEVIATARKKYKKTLDKSRSGSQKVFNRLYDDASRKAAFYSTMQENMNKSNFQIQNP